MQKFINQFFKEVWIYLFMLLVVVLSGCTTIKEVPVEKVITETEYRDRLQYDSIYTRDSIYLQAKGDTIYLSKYKYIYRDKLIRDTSYVHRTDSIQVPYPVEIEKKLTFWQKIKVDLGGYTLILVVGWLIWLIIKKRIR